MLGRKAFFNDTSVVNTWKLVQAFDWPKKYHLTSDWPENIIRDFFQPIVELGEHKTKVIHKHLCCVGNAFSLT